MALGHKDVDDIAALAHLEVTSQQRDEVADNLNRILTFVEQLSEVDTNDVAPMSHPVGDLVQRLRPDEVAHGDLRERAQTNAPDVADGFYRVPKVIE
ncbi:MAG: Asp-tRNA(Asn)/Glu-tRNA(Gln) amidotransferase subunit GatC [Gammaproteobacteria bacterium]